MTFAAVSRGVFRAARPARQAKAPPASDRARVVGRQVFIPESSLFKGLPRHFHSDARPERRLALKERRERRGWIEAPAPPPDACPGPPSRPTLLKKRAEAGQMRAPKLAKLSTGPSLSFHSLHFLSANRDLINGLRGRQARKNFSRRFIRIRADGRGEGRAGKEAASRGMRTKLEHGPRLSTEEACQYQSVGGLPVSDPLPPFRTGPVNGRVAPDRTSANRNFSRPHYV